MITNSFPSSLSEGARVNLRAPRPASLFFTCGIYIFIPLYGFILFFVTIHPFFVIMFNFLIFGISAVTAKSPSHLSHSYNHQLYCVCSLFFILPSLHFTIFNYQYFPSLECFTWKYIKSPYKATDYVCMVSKSNSHLQSILL